LVLALAILLVAAAATATEAGAPVSKKEAYLASKRVDPDARRSPATKTIVPLFARNLHTHEVMALEGPGVTPEAVDLFLRCWFTEEWRDIPDELVARMLQTAHHFGARTIHVVSGYRHVKYNKLLRKKGRQVALNSQHTEGHAIDFSLPGTNVTTLYKWLLAHHDGGVGYYRFSGFVHIDTGRKRTWRGT
jgi:uncharacterized protein YcbK (DUF882 family)